MGEKTFLIFKPDGMQHREEIYRILEERIEAKPIVTKKYDEAPINILEIMYSAHKKQSWFSQLIESYTGGPVEAVVFELGNSYNLKDLVKVIGDTNPDKAAPGTIRYRFGKVVQNPDKSKPYDLFLNVVHRSDRESQLLFEAGLYFWDHVLNKEIVQKKGETSDFLAKKGKGIFYEERIEELLKRYNIIDENSMIKSISEYLLSAEKYDTSCTIKTNSSITKIIKPKETDKVLMVEEKDKYYLLYIKNKKDIEKIPLK